MDGIFLAVHNIFPTLAFALFSTHHKGGHTLCIVKNTAENTCFHVYTTHGSWIDGRIILSPACSPSWFRTFVLPRQIYTGRNWFCTYIVICDIYSIYREKWGTSWIVMAGVCLTFSVIGALLFCVSVLLLVSIWTARQTFTPVSSGLIG